MIIIFIRSTVAFATLLLVLRLMGKRQIGEMQPFELVITLLISELACIPLTDISIPLVYGISAIVAIFILHQTLSVVQRASQTAKRVLSGKPSLVLNKNGVDFCELRRNNMDVEDLIESMRSAGFYSLDDLDYAIFESNGKLSTKEKIDYDKKKTALPLLIVSEGQLIYKNIQLLNLSNNVISDIIKRQGTKSIKQVGVMTIDGNGKVYFQKEGNKYTTFNIKLPEGTKW